MRYHLLLTASFLALPLLLVAPALRAEGELPEGTLKALKDATVFVKFDAGKVQGTGSGFVIRGKRETALVVTNLHVVRPLVVVQSKDKDKKLAKPVVGRIRDGKATVVFHSGTKREQSVAATVVAEDEGKDLAVLRVTGVKDLPASLDIQAAPKLSETMAVYVLGFPFGRALSTSKGNPSITVGKASVSSLRYNDAGDLALVQIDGALNPGNSGGPIVNTKGQLIGVAVARTRAGGGIGLAIPSQELALLLKGKVGGMNLQVTRWEKASAETKVELRLIDPLNRVSSVILHHAPARPKEKERVSGVPGAKRAKLDIKDRVATGTISLTRDKNGDSPVALQVEYVNADGQPVFSEVRQLLLKAPPPGGKGQPPVLVKSAPLSAEDLAKAVAGLKDADAARRQAACERLAKAPPGGEKKEVLAALAALLRDPDLLIRAAAVRAHLNWAGKGGVKEYLGLLKAETSLTVRLALIEGLGRLGGGSESAAGAVAACLAEPAERAAAAQALQAMGAAAAEKAVAARLSHRDPAVRLAACGILGVIGTEGSIEALKKAAEGLSAADAAAVGAAARKAVDAIAALGVRGK